MKMNQLAGAFSALFLRLKRACELHFDLMKKNSEAVCFSALFLRYKHYNTFPRDSTQLNKELTKQNWYV